MLAVIGTVPDPHFPLVHGPVSLAGDRIQIHDHTIPIRRGTPALIAAAVQAANYFGSPPVYAFLAGDIGRGDGSRQIYAFLAENLHNFSFSAMVFHYLQPDADGHAKVLFSVDALPVRPLLIADAGFMYAAKMSGQAEDYDFFTPDAGELAFLADDAAPHPFYTRGFILHMESKVPELIRLAYAHHNAPRFLVVKGEVDRIVENGVVRATIDQPSFPAMEAIGGTGDTITGLLGVLCLSGFSRVEAAIHAATVNRQCAAMVCPTPATSVAELIDAIPKALERLEMRSAGAFARGLENFGPSRFWRFPSQ